MTDDVSKYSPDEWRAWKSANLGPQPEPPGLTAGAQRAAELLAAELVAGRSIPPDPGGAVEYAATRLEAEGHAELAAEARAGSHGRIAMVASHAAHRARRDADARQDVSKFSHAEWVAWKARNRF